MTVAVCICVCVLFWESTVRPGTPGGVGTWYKKKECVFCVTVMMKKLRMYVMNRRKDLPLDG